MNKKTIGLLCVFLVLFSACKAKTETPSEKIKWQSYTEGMAAGKETGKKIFISFYADWCTFCEKMDKETFREKDVVSFVNNRFTAIRVNSEKELEVAQKYFVRGLPMTWFLDANGEKISSIPGFIPPEMFREVLHFVDSDSYKTMTFKEFVQKQEKNS
jgi:thioredoxin-related protein